MSESFQWLPIIGGLCLVAAVLLAAVAVTTNKKEKTKRSSKNQLAGKESGRFWQSVYSWLSSLRMTRRLLQSIRKRLEIGYEYDERGIRRKSATIFTITALCMFFLFLFFVSISKDLLLTGTFLVLMGFMTDTVLDISVAHVASKLMRQQLRFHEQLRHRYYEEQSVDNAVEEACQFMLEERAHEMFTQGEKMLDILSSADTDAAFEQYRETAPNKYLKMLAGMCVITREYGDSRIEKASVFLMSLGHLSDEIRSELFKRDRLLYALKSLNILTIVPLFFIQPIRNWAGESFAPMARFYNQSIGTVLELVMITITFFSYMAIRKLQQFDENRPEHVAKRRWDSEIYHLFLHPVVDRLKPRRYTVEYLKLENLLKRAVSKLRMEEVGTRQIVFGIIGFLLMLGISIFLQIQTAHRILYQPQPPEGFLGGKLSEEDELLIENQTQFDRSVLITLPKDLTEESLRESLHRSGEVSDAELIETTSRILNKWSVLQNNQFHWWELLLCFVFFAIGYYMPMVALVFQASIRMMDMEDEVAQFQTIILMLMHMPRVNVEEILEWMEMFSLHFKEALQVCLSDYNAGAEEALLSLKKKISFEPMTALIGNLLLAATDLPILQAFEELESEKNYSREKRKELNERTVEKKKNLGNVVGLLPLYALIVLYLMIPMVVSSMDEMSIFYKQMSSF